MNKVMFSGKFIYPLNSGRLIQTIDTFLPQDISQTAVVLGNVVDFPDTDRYDAQYAGFLNMYEYSHQILDKISYLSSIGRKTMDNVKAQFFPD